MTNKNSETCVFCQIVDGKLPAEKIYEDEKTLAFLTSGPVNPGHALVIPKKHLQNIYEADEPSLQATILTAQKVAKAIKIGLPADGVNVNSNFDRAAGQIVFHLHFHIIPRYENDGLHHWPHKNDFGEDAHQLAQKIISALDPKVI